MWSPRHFEPLVLIVDPKHLDMLYVSLPHMEHSPLMLSLELVLGRSSDGPTVHTVRRGGISWACKGGKRETVGQHVTVDRSKAVQRWIHEQS